MAKTKENLSKLSHQPTNDVHINTSHFDSSVLDSASGPVPYSLTNDYLFRAVMQENQNVLKGLLCSLLHLQFQDIISIEIKNPIVLGKQIDSKTFILDLKIMLNGNRIVNIEMQVTNYLDWPDRSIGYLSRIFDQLNHGSDYIETLPAHHISILTFTLFPEFPEFYSTYKLMNLKNHHIYSDKFTLSVLDLTQTQLATIEDQTCHLDYWARLFLAKTWEDIKMLAEKNDIIKEAAATMYAVSAEENIRIQCEARERYEYEQKAAIGCGKNLGLEVGKKIGEKLGREIGEKIGREAGEKIGREAGEKIGREAGEKRIATLINYLIRDNRNAEISSATADLDYRDKLYKEYNL